MKKCSLLIQCTFEDAILIFDRIRYHQGLLNSYILGWFQSSVTYYLHDTYWIVPAVGWFAKTLLGRAGQVRFVEEVLAGGACWVMCGHDMLLYIVHVIYTFILLTCICIWVHILKKIDNHVDKEMHGWMDGRTDGWMDIRIYYVSMNIYIVSFQVWGQGVSCLGVKKNDTSQVCG
jgi:hypothetical protein